MKIQYYIHQFKPVPVRLVFILQLFLIFASSKDDEYTDEGTQVELRAVFINCDPEGTTDSETTRFEREELFKHSALRDCSKKLAFTLKISNEPDKNYGDEYIPIEHVLDGPNKNRIRLLNPYILRLRRETPLQAYKLRKIDTVSGILTDANNQKIKDNDQRKRSRDQTKLPIQENLPLFTLKNEDGQLHRIIEPLHNTATQSYNNWVNKQTCRNITASSRGKRRVQNIVVEQEIIDDDKNAQHILTKDRYYQGQYPAGNIHNAINDLSPNMIGNENDVRSAHHRDNKKYLRRSENRSRLPSSDKNRHIESHRTYRRSSTSNEKKHTIGTNSQLKHAKIKSDMHELQNDKITERSTTTYNNLGDEFYKESNTDATEKDFAVFEIGYPDVWYTAHLQLYEKLTTTDGKTVWNDMTKGEIASVSSLSSEWTGQDMNVRYRPAEWVTREYFTLPDTSLCLLAPIRNSDSNYFPDMGSTLADEYIVVPAEDILGFGDGNNLKRDSNFSDSQITTTFSSKNDKGHRRVKVRVSRALFGGAEERFNIVSQGIERFLTLPSSRPHHAKIEVEARADENQIVRVGASGRITTAVADSTRRTRTILLLQATNTGLAAARFRAVARDCSPELSDFINTEESGATVTGPVMIPPRHTRQFQLELPIEMPGEIAHCSVALMNDDEESVAVRDVTLRKGDRCFCVWHCECVCLSKDPKLLCREMPEPQQVAAGLALRDKARHTRSVCYKDVVTINIFVIAIGVIMALLLLGMCKAFLGLLFPCVRAWGLDHLLQTPRKLDHYYESSLCSRPVEYDDEGWPIHPHTKKRTVHLVSVPMEFVLNVIFFVSAPCLIVCEAVKKTTARFKDSKDTCANKWGSKHGNNNTKKCFSSQDLQSGEPRWQRRRGGLRRWMTPQAKDLSTDIWRKGLSPQPYATCEMRPLLHEERYRSGGDRSMEQPDFYTDSEQDDTEYVLMQMQKSKESLARNSRKHNDSGTSSVNTQWKREGVQKNNKN